MATKAEIIDALRTVEERVELLAPQIRLNLEESLLSGTWTVHDALCHLAADSNGVPGFVARMERVANGLPRRESGFSVDDYNERNIAQRKTKPVDEVFAEIRTGLQTDCNRVQELDEAFLQRELPSVRGEVMPISDQMRAYLGSHPNSHLDDIEKAITAGA